LNTNKTTYTCDNNIKPQHVTSIAIEQPPPPHYNDFIPPVNAPPPPIRTRGSPTEYRFIGNLFRKQDNRIGKLFGRQLYHDTWEYYCIIMVDHMETKIPLKVKNNTRLFDQDEINVPLLEQPFIVHLYPTDVHYTPYALNVHF